MATRTNSTSLDLYTLAQPKQFFPGVYCAVYDCSLKLDKPPPNPENDPYCKVSDFGRALGFSSPFFFFVFFLSPSPFLNPVSPFPAMLLSLSLSRSSYTKQKQQH